MKSRIITAFAIAATASFCIPMIAFAQDGVATEAVDTIIEQLTAFLSLAGVGGVISAWIMDAIKKLPFLNSDQKTAIHTFILRGLLVVIAPAATWVIGMVAGTLYPVAELIDGSAIGAMAGPAAIGVAAMYYNGTKKKVAAVVSEKLG